LAYFTCMAVQVVAETGTPLSQPVSTSLAISWFGLVTVSAQPQAGWDFKGWQVGTLPAAAASAAASAAAAAAAAAACAPSPTQQHPQISIQISDS
jgi:hypothetical protein